MAAPVYLLLFLGTFIQLAASKLPHGWKPCKTSSPDFNDCMSREIENAIRTLKHGDKKLGLLPIDPMVVSKMVIDQGSGPVAIKLSYKDLLFEGLSDIKIRDFSGNWKNGFVLTAFIKKLINRGTYKIEGKILSLPITGDGPCLLVWDDLELKIKIVMRPVEKNGKKFIKTEKFLLDLNPKRVHFKFDNLFNGNKELGEVMNTLVNENWETVLNETKPATSVGLSRAFTQIADLVLAKLPVNEVILN